MWESGLKLYSLTLTPIVVAKQRREPLTFALDMRERPVCYLRRVFFADETMITDNVYDPKQKFVCGTWFPKSASPLARKGARLSKKLCCFALWYGQSMQGRVIEGILNSSTFVSTINEVFTKETTRYSIGWLIVVQDNAPCHLMKKVSLFLLISFTYAFFYYLDHGWTQW